MFTDIQNAAFGLVASLLAWFYEQPVIGGNYGMAIIMLTLAVMVILIPLTMSSTRSTIAMMAVQPELKKIQKEFADDKQRQQQEMMALYSKHGVNPIGGCLPILAQLPVFLVLFNVLRGLTRRFEQAPYFSLTERAQELAGSPLTEEAARTFEPQYISHTSQLYLDLQQETEMRFGFFDLGAQPNEIVQDNLLTAIPYVLLTLFLVGSSYFQQWQVTSRRGVDMSNPTPQQQTQQMMMRFLPLMSGIWGFFFPTGLVLYWVTSNIFRIGQQEYIGRRYYGEDGAGTKAMQAVEAGRLAEEDAKSSKGKKKKASVAADEDSDGGGHSDDDDNESSVSNGKAASSGGSKNGKNGSASAGASPEPVAGDRNAQWAEMRARRAKTKARAKKSSSGGSATSSRVTPKGTKPTAAKKKRKR
jgi:YidC/Oxa1 family membrane protein insertase